jgi:hypothetical protein
MESVQNATSSCLTCRVMGTTTFVGVSLYCFYERSLAQTRAHKAVLLVGGLGSLGVAYLRWRL